MDYYIQIIIVVILAMIILYYNRPGTDITEAFGAPDPNCANAPGSMGALAPAKGYRPGHARRHPDQDMVDAAINKQWPYYSPYNDLEANTVASLKDTILTDCSRTSRLQSALNDAVTYKPGEIRPYNDAGSLLSEAQASSGVELNNQFDNTFYELWLTDEAKERGQVLQRAENIVKNRENCIDYKHINQCMSVCKNSPNCTGFYIDSPNKCCMLQNPPYNTDRHSYGELPDNIDNMGKRSINKLLERAEETDGKIIFNYIRTDGGNSSYKVDMDRVQCKKLCPKCIIGRCPPNYRCTNMMADPRYNYSCILTNEDRYDETKGRTFDDPTVPYLEDQYGINEYADYMEQYETPVLTVPENYVIDIDGPIMPTPTELSAALKKFNNNHVGPNTYDPKQSPLHVNPLITRQQAGQEFPTCLKHVTTTQAPSGSNKSCLYKNIKTAIESPVDSTGKPINPSDQPTKKSQIETFDLWVNREDQFHPEMASRDYDFINIRGYNDPINLGSYREKDHIAPYLRPTPCFTAGMIERPTQPIQPAKPPVEKFSLGYYTEPMEADTGRFQLRSVDKLYTQYANSSFNRPC